MSYNEELQANNVDLHNILNSIKELPRNTPIDTSSTLPPPVGFVTATGANQSIKVSFEAVSEEFEEYLGEVAYIVVVKAEEIPESPTDGIVVKLDKNGAVIG